MLKDYKCHNCIYKKLFKASEGNEISLISCRQYSTSLCRVTLYKKEIPFAVIEYFMPVPYAEDVPPDYKVWNIGEPTPRGFLPLCKIRGPYGYYSIEQDGLMLMHVPYDVWRRAMKDATCKDVNSSDIAAMLESRKKLKQTKENDYVKS